MARLVGEVGRGVAMPLGYAVETSESSSGESGKLVKMVNGNSGGRALHGRSAIAPG